MPFSDADIDRRLAEIRERPELLARYDVTGDGELDEHEWELVRRIVGLELKTAEERGTTYELETQPKVLKDRFEVVGLLGRGGQAVTYLARDGADDGRHVVVKELSVRVAADWKSIELFEREAQILERLNHPAIPRYIDAFVVEDEGEDVRFLLVQEFVDGEDLGHFVERGGRWRQEDAARRMVELCEVLEYLHALSPAVIHRDIKPSNLIIDRGGVLRLVDFGAVQMVVPATVGGSTIIGTSGYVPMEQYMGRAVPASDLYALGATVVHLITGIHPADMPFERGRLRVEDLSVTPEFRAILDELLEPVAEQRPQSASSLRDRVLPLTDESYSREFDILSTPQGASVLIGDSEIGQTPLKWRLRVSDLPTTVRLRLFDHEPTDLVLGLSSPSDQRVLLTLTPSVTIEVESRPSGATVFVNDDARTRTPGCLTVQRTELPVKVRLELDGHVPIERALDGLQRHLVFPLMTRQDGALVRRAIPSTFAFSIKDFNDGSIEIASSPNLGPMLFASLMVAAVAAGVAAFSVVGTLVLMPLVLVPFVTDRQRLLLSPLGWRLGYATGGPINELESVQVAEELLILRLANGHEHTAPIRRLPRDQRAMVEAMLNGTLAKLKGLG